MIKDVSKKKEMHHDDISNLLKKIPEFEEKKTKILIHLDLAKKVTEIMANKDNHIMRLIEMEQTIISGVNEQLTPVNEGTISTNLLKTVKKVARPEDLLRLLAIYINCYTLPKADYKSLLSLVNSDEDRDILE